MWKDQVALITGCSTGIGRALALAFAAEGHRVYATARRPESIADLTGERITTLQLDVTDPESIARAVETVVSEADRVDILVNNAGYGQIAPMIAVPLEKLRLQLETNVIGAVAMMQAVAPHMIRHRHGRIVQIGSISGILTTPFAGSYCASKAALHALSESARMELAPFGVSVLIVQPGGVTTRFGDTSTDHVPDLAGSVYEPIAKHIAERAQTSQHGAAAAETVARQIVEAATRDTAPRILRVGRGGYRYPLLKRLVPDALLDRVLMGMFGLKEL
jgi:NAD(P)-dependent dehydrogenase (short-subunit alcohol dehydrogenase family)